MKKVLNVVLAAVAVAVMAVPAMAGDKLVVKDDLATPNTVFKVESNGAITGGYWNTSVIPNAYKINNYWNPTTKKYGFGTSNPLTSLHIVEEAATADRGLTIAQHTTGGQSASIAIKRSRGTEAVPTILSNGDNVAAFHMMGYDGNPWTPPALPVYFASSSLIWTVDGPTAVNSNPIATVFWNGSTAADRLERFRISSNGRFRVSNPPSVPANTTVCTKGDLIFDTTGGNLYMCIIDNPGGTINAWRRSAFTTY